MPILIKKPTGGKLVKGRDHKLDYTMVWKHSGLPVNLDSEIDAQYITIKRSDSLADDEAEIAINSEDNADQFITRTAADGDGTYWIKKSDQEEIVADTVKYCMDVVVILTDGTEWPFVLDYNVVFTMPATRETEHGAI